MLGVIDLARRLELDPGRVTRLELGDTDASLRSLKRIGANRRGVTAVFGLPLLPFHVDVTGETPRLYVLRSIGLPVRDELVLTPDGWDGRGLIFGLEFCRFRLLRSA